MEYDLPQITQELHFLSKVLSLPPHILGGSLLIDLSSENLPVPHHSHLPIHRCLIDIH